MRPTARARWLSALGVVTLALAFSACATSRAPSPAGPSASATSAGPSRAEVVQAVRALGHRDGKVIILALAQVGSGHWQATVHVVPPLWASYSDLEFGVVLAKRSGHWRVIGTVTPY